MSMRLTADVAALVKAHAELEARVKRLEERERKPFAPSPWPPEAMLLVPDLPKPELYEVKHRGFGRWWVMRNGKPVEGPVSKEAAEARTAQLKAAVEENRAA